MLLFSLVVGMESALSFTHQDGSMAALDMPELLRRVKRATKRDTPTIITQFFEEKDKQDERIRRNHNIAAAAIKALARNPVRVNCYCVERYLFRSWVNYTGALFDIMDYTADFNVTPASRVIRRKRDYLEDITLFMPSCRVDVPREYWFLLTTVFQTYPVSFVEEKRIFAKLSALDRTAIAYWSALPRTSKDEFSKWFQKHAPLFYSYFTGLENIDYLLLSLFPLKLR